MLNYEETPPVTELRPWLRCVWRLWSEPGFAPPATERIVPDGCAEIVIHRGLPFAELDGHPQPRVVLAGQILRFIDLRPSAEVDIVALRFEPGGLVPFLPCGQDELCDGRFDLGVVEPRLERALVGAAGGCAKDLVSRLQRTLLARLPRTAHPGLVAAATQHIKASGGHLRLAGLGAELGVSSRTLERGFRREVGLSPKQLARIVRFKRAHEWLQESEALQESEGARRVDGTWLALECGYYDQAHLIRDYRHFAGQSPTGFASDGHALARLLGGS